MTGAVLTATAAGFTGHGILLFADAEHTLQTARQSGRGQREAEKDHPAPHFCTVMLGHAGPASCPHNERQNIRL